MTVTRVPIQTASGTYHVFTNRVGSHARRKILALHGGPGATHEYFADMHQLLDAEVIYYDQLGCGLSDRPDNASLWTLARYVDEVEQVRRRLDLGRDDFYLLGHSWGGIVALEYALTHGGHLKGLMVANAMASIPAFNRSLMAAVERELDVPLEHADTAQRYYLRFMCRQIPWPESVTRSFASTNPVVAQALRGSDPIVIGGELGTWDRMADLPHISTPTLIVHGGDDTCDRSHMEWVAQRVQRGRFLLCPRSRHLPMLDEPEVFSSGVNEFMTAVDAM